MKMSVSISMSIISCNDLHINFKTKPFDPVTYQLVRLTGSDYNDQLSLRCLCYMAGQSMTSTQINL